MPIGVLIALGYSFMIGYPFQAKRPLLCRPSAPLLCSRIFFTNWKLVGAAKGYRTAYTRAP